jgi:hypothetical protein
MWSEFWTEFVSIAFPKLHKDKNVQDCNEKNMLTKKSEEKCKCDHYAHNAILRIILGKVFQDFKNGQK